MLYEMRKWIKISEQRPNNGAICVCVCQHRNDKFDNPIFYSIDIGVFNEAEQDFDLQNWQPTLVCVTHYEEVLFLPVI